jgi:hypothetical protein
MLCQWGSFSPYKDYSCLLRWQANIFVRIPFQNYINECMKWFLVCIQTLASLTHLMTQKPDWATAIQSVHNVSRTKVGLQNAVTTEPYIKMSRMSNQRKAEFVGDIFHMRSFWGGHGEIPPKTCFIQVGMLCQKYYFSDQSSFQLL